MSNAERAYFPAAKSAAYSMVSRHGVDAAFFGQREVDTKIRQGDLNGAIETDQVRRELLKLIINLEPPAPY